MFCFVVLRAIGPPDSHVSVSFSNRVGGVFMRNRRRVTRASGSDIVSSVLPDGSTLNRSMNRRRRVSREFPRASRRASGRVS